ncbi:uncharacterized protein LOC123560670 [Mercenaria mercenaria]|uniref:uncharacterized protein LOC123560670 n=1 Tax=Mercenaria mercenaria TaxID=6596 RepID=UPI00234E55F1|nr:uncharacterized protein LOC123560670 [Mercenaria mercenaria]
MRLREFFYTEDVKDDSNRKSEDDPRERFKLRKKSYFTPNKGRDMWLDLYIELIKNDIVNSLKRSGKLNISHDEQSAFQSLLHNDDIIIRPADKRSGIVIIDKAEYINKLYAEMKSNESYMETEEDLTMNSLKIVKQLVNKMYREGAISKEMQAYLIPRYPRSGKLNGNPKLHKPGAPLRTIVNGINTPTEKLAEVAEYELNEYVTQSPSYLRDTTDFIDKISQIKQPIPSDTILFCFDVCKLYPSVPRVEGLQACEEGLTKRSKPIIPTRYGLRMIETVLDNNNFNLGQKHYVQTDGVAIGSRLGKNFACSYMQKWDEQLMNFEVQPWFYKRFIDDGFGLWTGGIEKLKQFSEFANNIHQNIKVELRWSHQKLEFLDTLVRLENGNIYTELYRKPSDKQLYIQKTSCHPAHTKKALAYGLGIRIKRICEKVPDYIKHREELKQQLRKRGYSGREIEQQLQRVDKLDRQELLKTKKKTEPEEKRVPLVLTYSKMLPDIRNILRKHQKVLYNSERMRTVFQEPPLLAFRRDKNIRDVLVHGKTNRAFRSSPDICSCHICLLIFKGEVADTTKRHTYQTVTHTSCSDTNLVYGLLCKPCNKTIYVGETERSLKERISEHLRDIRQQVDKPINRHFIGHTERDLQVVVLQKLYHEGRLYRQILEEKWMKKLATKFPHGCNVKYNT